MDKKLLLEFLLSARTKTYAGNQGKVESLLPGSVQYEFGEGDLLYRDVYNIGNGIFPGLETVYYKNQPVWSMSYFGDFSQITEEEADKVLRQALTDKWQTTRTYNKVEWETDDYKYVCNGSGSIDKLEGTEEITKDDKRIYYFYYAGGFIG
jgi:hypothetical protein